MMIAKMTKISFVLAGLLSGSSAVDCSGKPEYECISPCVWDFGWGCFHPWLPWGENKNPTPDPFLSLEADVEDKGNYLDPEDGIR